MSKPITKPKKNSSSQHEHIKFSGAFNTQILNDKLLEVRSKNSVIYGLNFSEVSAYVNHKTIEILRDNFQELQQLNFNGCQISGRWLRVLGKALTNLKTLDIGGNNKVIFLKSWINTLSSLPNLEDLSFDKSTVINNKWLKDLNKLPKLRVLNLSNCNKITDEGLKRLPQLQSLDLSGSSKIKTELQKNFTSQPAIIDAFKKAGIIVDKEEKAPETIKTSVIIHLPQDSSVEIIAKQAQDTLRIKASIEENSTPSALELAPLLKEKTSNTSKLPANQIIDKNTNNTKSFDKVKPNTKIQPIEIHQLSQPNECCCAIS